MAEEKTYPIRIIEIKSDEENGDVNDNKNVGSPLIINVSKSGLLYHPVPPTEFHGGVDLKDINSDEGNGGENNGATGYQNCANGNQSIINDATKTRAGYHRYANGNQCTSGNRVAEPEQRNIVRPDLKGCNSSFSQAEVTPLSIETDNIETIKSEEFNSNSQVTYSTIDSVLSHTFNDSVSKPSKTKKGRSQLTNSDLTTENSSASSWNCLKGNNDRHDTGNESSDQLSNLNSSLSSSNDWHNSSESYSKTDRRKRRICESSVREGLDRIEEEHRRDAENQGYVIIDRRNVPSEEYVQPSRPAKQSRRKRGFCIVL